MSVDGGARSYDRSVGGQWVNASGVAAQDYECGYCGNQVGASLGYSTSGSNPSLIVICPRCKLPTFFDRDGGDRYPPSPPGPPVFGIPRHLADLYDEARNAAGAGAYTAAVMVCRKVLMNVAVNEGAKEGLKFVQYVDYLQSQHFFSPKMRPFIDYIRDLGNEANHEIAPKSEQDATAAIEFVAALLRHNYEVPGKVPPRQAASAGT